MMRGIDARLNEEALRRELDLKEVPRAVEERLYQVYSELPNELPKERPARRALVWARRGLCAAASFALVFGGLLGLNKVSPALAEGLPFVGGIFSSVNSSRSLPAVNRTAAQRRLSELSVKLEEKVTAPAEGAFQKPVTAELKEVYYDGDFLFAGIELSIDGDYDRVQETMWQGYDIVINGESQIRHDEKGTVDYPHDRGNGFCDMSDDVATRIDRGRYALQRAFRVPDELRGAEELEVSLCFDGLADGLIGINTSNFSLSFTAQKTAVETRSISCQGVETPGGVRLVEAHASSVAVCIVADVPEDYEKPICGAAFEDGILMGSLGGTHYSLGDGMTRYVTVYSGLREGESRNLVWRMTEKENLNGIMEVLLLDFNGLTASAGGREDVKRAPAGDYACGVEAIESLSSGYIVEKYHADQDKPLVYIASAKGKKHLRVEIWQEEELICQVDTRDQDTGWNSDAKYWEYEESGGIGPDRKDIGKGYGHWILFVEEGYAGLDLAKPITVRAYEDSGELVLDEEIELCIYEGSSAGVVDPTVRIA